MHIDHSLRMKNTQRRVNHRIIDKPVVTLISKLRTFERLLVLPQQLGQLPNEVEEEIVLLDRNYLLGYLDEKRETLAALQSQSIRDILAEITRFR